MQVKLVFLGRLEELAGRAFEEIDRPPAEWDDLVEWLGHRYSLDLSLLVADDKVKVAVNGALIADKRDLVLEDGDEIAFLPPVSGG
jgi:molybdopterin synthase sulfur carrier subunit